MAHDHEGLSTGERRFARVFALLLLARLSLGALRVMYERFHTTENPWFPTAVHLALCAGFGWWLIRATWRATRADTLRPEAPHARLGWGGFIFLWVLTIGGIFWVADAVIDLAPSPVRTR